MSVGYRRPPLLSCERLEGRDAPAIVPTGPEFRVNVNTTVAVAVPAVAVAGTGDFIVTWEANGIDGDGFAVLARRYNSAGTALNNDFQVNTFTTGSQQNPAVAADATGNFVVVWGSASVQDGSREGVYLRRYSASGAAINGETQVNQFTLNIQGKPAIAMDGNGDFVVAWQSNYQDGDGYAIYARKYNASGTPLTGEFLVNQSTLGDQMNASVAMDAAGDFVVAWQSPDANGYGAYARRYGSTGAPMGNEFQVNQFTTGDQAKPVVAMNTAGDFMAAWESSVQDGGTSGIYGRRYNSAGVAQGNEFRVNTYTTNSQSGAAIAANANGDMFVTWTSIAQDGSLGGIYGQRVAANGQFLNGEMQIHTTTIGNQTDAAVACDAAGNSTVVWSSIGSPLSGIIAQRFAAPPIPTAAIAVDDGSGQRSSIRYLALNFNTIVNIAPGAITLTGPLGAVALTSDYSGSTATKTNLKLTFSGAGVTPAGLIDGHYTLSLASAGITNVDGVAYDGDSDGLPGGNGNLNFHRYFGDVNGSGVVDALDFFYLLINFGTNSSQPGFKYWLDANGDGNVDAIDFGAFLAHFGTYLP